MHAQREGRGGSYQFRPIVGVNLASFALIFESSALTVALPALAREWRASMGTMQWVADASLLTTALLLLFAGRLSDEKGTRRVMRLGLIGAVACSIGASLTPGPIWLIAIRLVQGACVALIVPGTLGLLRLFIRDREERLRAMTWWSGISIAASGAGPIVGGVIVDAGAWRAIFVVPAVLSMAAWWCLRQREADTPVQSHCVRAEHGGEGGAALGRRGLLPAALLKDRVFIASNLASGTVYFAVYGLSFALATSLPESLSSSSLRTGLYMTAPAVLILLLASPIARVGGGERRWWFAAIGSLICSAGLLVLAGVMEQATPLMLVALTAVIGVGFALTLGPLDALMMDRPSPEHSNTASAVGHITARVAGFSAIALGGAITVSGWLALAGAAIAALMAVMPPAVAAREDTHGGLVDEQEQQRESGAIQGRWARAAGRASSSARGQASLEARAGGDGTHGI